jgi:hypothetical protein
MAHFTSTIVTAWLAGCALRCPQARLPPHPAREKRGGGGGGGGFQPGLAVRAQNIGLLAQVLAGALFGGGGAGGGGAGAGGGGGGGGGGVAGPLVFITYH